MESLRKVLSVYRSEAEAAEAKGQDGDAIRRECENHFEAAATCYRAERGYIYNREARKAIAQIEGGILNYIPECWR